MMLISILCIAKITCNSLLGICRLFLVMCTGKTHLHVYHIYSMQISTILFQPYTMLHNHCVLSKKVLFRPITLPHPTPIPPTPITTPTRLTGYITPQAALAEALYLTHHSHALITTLQIFIKLDGCKKLSKYHVFRVVRYSLQLYLNAGGGGAWHWAWWPGGLYPTSYGIV